MKRASQSVFVLGALFAALAAVAVSPLGAQMRIIASNLKTVQNSLKANDFATAKNAALTMAKAASDSKTLFPPNVAGNAQAESAFTAAITNLETAINERLVRALDQHEMNDAQAAIQFILDIKADGHSTFIPHD